MKRNLVIATVAAAVLVGGGAYTAVAVSADASTSSSASASASASTSTTTAVRDDDDHDEELAAPAGSVTLSEAVAAALKQTPGTVDSVDLADDGDGHWEVDVLGKDDRTHELRVDSSNGTARVVDGDDGDDDADDRHDRAALRSASVDANEAVSAALRAHPGATVTSVDFDDDGGAHWEVELHDGKADDETEARVDARTGKVSHPQDDDASDD
ncbi:PepSY domain-containing protein [Streptomyces sp. ISL-10]|uniref:PepSY domain-containing protein n=1 Tax=Streptomyces sp. ISL-10 TaxID=2819172 RepID=UPI001BE7CD87|nr:PepSY domain-containing protein [Streptomyces sp. ISL-10]MBT2368585.1 PepSY domain-containing protein [Streptomyces sp. ISL-10]